MVTFTEEIINGKLHFLYSKSGIKMPILYSETNDIMLCLLSHFEIFLFFSIFTRIA